MTNMNGIYRMQSSGALAAYGSFQSFEAKVPSYERSSQVCFSSQKFRVTFGAGSCGLCFNKPKPRFSTLEYDYWLQGRGSRVSKSTTSLGVHNSRDNDATTSTEPSGQQKNGKSEANPEELDPGAAKSSGMSALDTYFSKLKVGTESSKTAVNGSKSNSVATAILSHSEQHNKIAGAKLSSSVASDAGREGKEVQGLKALDAYFEKLNPRKPVPEPIHEEVVPAAKTAVEQSDEELFLKSLIEAKEDYEKYQSSRKEDGSSSAGDLKFQVKTKVSVDGNDMDLSSWELPEEQSSNSNLINTLVAINIAVYLFGLASPHEALGITDSSLPFVYGAKVNDLILAGQWWRFITPMFLHASILHLGLGSWALLSFGPAVQSAYGTLGFAMIYFLGGIFGDLTSFFHTPEWTVGGTGPIYALVGTWVVYLLKNREIIGKDIADDMIRKVVILSALNVALCNSLPIDDWTHLGATLIGTFFGILASPTMQLNVALKEVTPEKVDEDADAYLWFNNGASPVRLALIFSLCLGIFFILYQLSISGSGDFYLLQDNDAFS